VSALDAPRVPPLRDPAWQATAGAGSALLAGLAIALAAPSHTVLAISVSLAGAAVAALLLAPRLGRALHRHPALIGVGAVVVVSLLWIGLDLTGAGADRATRELTSLPVLDRLGWLWELGHASLVSLLLMTLAITGGLVLIADAMRVRLGLGRHRLAPWEQLTAPSGSRLGFPWSAVAGVLLVGWAAFLGVSVAGRYVSGNAALQLLLLVLAAAAAAVVIGTPLLIAAITRTDRDEADLAREEERQRVAAHLHDSVLQTLALVQRQAHDPTAIARLARRQEHALRAWMAGESELLGDTVCAALRDVVAAVEDEEQGLTVQLSAIGDRPLDSSGEALVAAAREALRNATRHAAGAPIFVFAEISREAVEVFVRDEGPGFDLDAVPPERRGLRDAVIGRMAAVGGHATVESARGEGTEIALRIGPVGPRA
jgi:signal transduction histidine kinase